MVTHKIVAYLLTLALGYWVLTLADKQAGLTQKIGKVIGWIILIVSLSGPLCILGSCLSGHCGMSGHCCSMGMPGGPMNQGGMKDGCPMGMGEKGMMDGDKSNQTPPTAKKK
jgi:hypothetical protein